MNISTEWVIFAPGAIRLPGTEYEIIRTHEGQYQAYHNNRKVGFPCGTLEFVKTCVVQPHMRDLLAVGVEP